MTMTGEGPINLGGGVPVKSPRAAIEELYERVQRLETALITVYHACSSTSVCPWCAIKMALEKAVTP